MILAATDGYLAAILVALHKAGHWEAMVYDLRRICQRRLTNTHKIL